MYVCMSTLIADRQDSPRDVPIVHDDLGPSDEVEVPAIGAGAGKEQQSCRSTQESDFILHST